MARLVVLGCSLVIIPAMGKLTSLFLLCSNVITVQEMSRFCCNTVIYMDNELASSENQAHLFFYREINKFNSSFHRVAGGRASPYRRVSNLLPFRLYSINLKTEFNF